MEQSSSSQDIDALFKHMIENLEHDLEEVCDWHFMLTTDDRERLAAIGDSLESEFIVCPMETQCVGDDGEISDGNPCIAVIARGALKPDEVKALAARFTALAETEGITYDGVSCYDAMTEDVMEAMFGWLGVEDAVWRLRHFTDIGLAPNESMDWEFAFAADSLATLQSLAGVLGESGHKTVDPEDDEDGPFMTARFRGLNNGRKLEKHYRNVEKTAAKAGAKLLGLQFPEDEDDEA